VQILLWPPNLVGYARLAILFLGLTLRVSRPGAAYSLFLLTFGLDVLDGALARRFGQVRGVPARKMHLSCADLYGPKVNWIWAI